MRVAAAMLVQMDAMKGYVQLLMEKVPGLTEHLRSGQMEVPGGGGGVFSTLNPTGTQYAIPTLLPTPGSAYPGVCG